MIPLNVVQKIRLSTCAVFSMPVKHEEAYPNAKPGDSVETASRGEKMKVQATAFLIREDLVLTNRHVIAKIYEDYKTKGSIDHWYIQFTYPRSQNSWTQTMRRVKKPFAFVDPAYEGDLKKGGLDVGLLSFSRNPEEMKECLPVEFGELENIVVGTDIAVCGFPCGNQVLVNPDLGVNRFGPVIHQGIISAISPIDVVDPRKITTFLTDLHIASGMSGSPVFLPSSGRVIGLLYGGAVATIGLVQPVDRKRVESWISVYNHHQNGMREIYIKPGGDIVSPGNRK